MSFLPFRRLGPAAPRPRAGRAPRRRPDRVPLRLELLESRLLPSTLPYLLKDVNTNTGGSYPSNLRSVNGVLDTVPQRSLIASARRAS